MRGVTSMRETWVRSATWQSRRVVCYFLECLFYSSALGVGGFPSKCSVEEGATAGLFPSLEVAKVSNCETNTDEYLGLGFQVFNATNDTITIKDNMSTKEFLEKECPGTKFTRELGQKEAPLSNRKIREVLGFKDVHDWKKYL